MAKHEHRRTSVPPPIVTEVTPEQEAEARASSLSTIVHEFKIDQALERERKRLVDNPAPVLGEVTPAQEYEAHTSSVATILAEFAEQEAASPPRPIHRGPDEASLELIKAEHAKNVSRQRV